MPPPLYRRLEYLPEPVEAFEATIPTGVSPFAVIGFKASLIREGSARVEGNFKSFAVAAGDLVLMRPGTSCSSISLTPLQLAVVRVDPMFLVDQVRWARPSESRTRRETYQELLARAQQPVRLHLDKSTFPDVAKLFGQLTLVSGRQSELGRTISRATELIWMIEALLMQALVSPCPLRQSRGGLTTPSTRDEIAAVLQTMSERYSTRLSLGELAREASLSESALRRAVLAETGVTPREYLHRLRLIRFEELVAESTIPLGEAARMAGWSSPAHARAVFARSHGMSPREFRAEAQEARRADWRRAIGA